MQMKEMLQRLGQPAGGVAFLGIAAILYGIACLLQGEFSDFWQPVPQGLPLRQPLAYLCAGLLILGGVGLLIARTVRPAAMAVLVVFGFYDACYLLQLVGPPADVKALMGLAEQSSVVVGCWAILLRMRGGGSATVATARITFGVCSVIFGLSHLTALEGLAKAVPEWLPGGQIFWAAATGVGHLAVGLGLLANRLAVSATRLGALMYSCFVFLGWVPEIFRHPTLWLRWEGAGISLCMAGALWLVGDLLAERRQRADSANPALAL
jgi:uncharacterized membrane protein